MESQWIFYLHWLARVRNINDHISLKSNYYSCSPAELGVTRYFFYRRIETTFLLIVLEQFPCLYLHLHKNKHNHTIQTTLNRQVSHSGNHISNSPNVFYMLYRLIAHLLHDSFVSIPRILSSGSLIRSTDELIINLQQKRTSKKLSSSQILRTTTRHIIRTFLITLCCRG